MEELKRKEKAKPSAFIHTGERGYSITYYIPLEQALKEMAKQTVLPQPGDEEPGKSSGELGYNELLFPPNNLILSPDALSHLDDNRYSISYYINLFEKANKHKAKGDFNKEVDESTPDSILFYSREVQELSADALSEAGGKKYKKSYYIDLANYYKEVREYEEKTLRLHLGDKEAFEDKMDPLIFYSKEVLDLTANAYSEIDGKKYKMSYYQKLSEYQQERREYENKLLLYHAGDKDIFERKEEGSVVKDTHSLSIEALSYVDGEKYDSSYYENLKNYYDEMQGLNDKIIDTNPYEEEKNEEDEILPPIFYSRETQKLSSEALSEIDGGKHRMSYYVELENYYKELQEYETKKLLGGYMSVDEEEQGYIAPRDIIDMRPDQKKEEETEKIWTPGFGDMMATVKGKLSSQVIDNVFETMGRLDGNFNDGIISPPIKLQFDCVTELVSEDMLMSELNRIYKR
ncbi:MAG TPA: hypothetical protein PL110_06490 [Candidatus Eremiobacteraeota bacterium]|nr:MAG: hypothetical protein BWY64_01884 [bacterium ADurb.Bin363]HPZ07742.1 hypothetical protein [Candidatus Eremiobacteraeota bacterium]